MEPEPDVSQSAAPNPDAYLLLLRWIAVLVAVLLSLFGTFPGAAWVPYPLALALALTLNLLLSAYAWRQRPFATRRPHPILIADAAQAGLATLLLGGYHSAFFALFLLLAVELAVAWPVRLAALGIFSAGALHVLAAFLNAVGQSTGLAAYMAVGKLLILLLVGALATAFSEQLRREEDARQAALAHATQLTVLNELFFQLNQPRADLALTWSALLDAARHLLHADMGLVVLCDTTLGCWRQGAGFGAGGLAANTAITDWGWLVAQQELYTAGPAYHQPLPRPWAHLAIQAVVGIRLNAPAGGAPGALLIARHGAALSDQEWLLLQALGREAELALRSAHLYASEHAQVLRLQQFEQTRQSFLSAVAHELRTPLTVLKTLLFSVNEWDQVPAAERQEILTMMGQNLSRLESLISDFLESTRLEAGAVTLHRQPLDLAHRTQRVLDNLRPLFESKQQQVTLDVPAGLPRVDADQRRVDQVISSLLHNAYKFTPAGGTIACVLRQAGDGVQTCIEDNGPGIPPPAREHIFDKFYSASSESALAGVGLGLFICQQVVALHHGRLWFEERAGGGSRFCFTLPVAAEGNDGQSHAEDPGY
jgi:signal transduction histidine kinase